MRPAAAVLACLALTTALAAEEPARGFEVTRLDEGVHAVIRREPVGMMFDANNAFIVNDEDVVVVDANATASSTRETIAALRRITSKPVRYVVNTHWHEDHILGNQVYREAFPGAEFIGHASTRADLTTIGAENRRQALEGGPGFVATLRRLLDEGRSLTGAALTEEERAAYASDSRLVERYVAEAALVPIILPTIAAGDRLTLHRGGRTIEILHLGRAHTGADLVVHLPAERIAIAGDLVSWPVPLVGTTSHPAEFGRTLERLLDLRAATIVPGHGPVMRDDTYPRLLVRLLTAIRERTEAAVARGETLDQARKSVDLSEFRALITGDSQFRGFAFDNYVAIPAVAAAYREAKESR